MSTSEIEDEVLKSIKASTIEVFSTMLMMDVNADNSFIENEKNVATDLISSLHFFGRKYMGKIAVFSSGMTACHLAGAMLGIAASEVDADIKDGMGEIVNMIAGSAKVKLEENMGELHLLTPWVISGRNLNISSSSGRDTNMSIDSQAQFSWLMTKFSYNNGHFFVGVQPNEVPQSDASGSENKLSELQEENIKLQAENKALKATVKEAGVIAS